MKLKKLFFVLLALALVLLLGVCAAAEGGDAPDVYVSGSCGAEGSNVTWTLSTDGVLTISGRGEMKNYRHMQPDMAPWYKSTGAHTDYPSVVKTVVEEGVTGIGDYAFHGLRQLSEVSLPSTVTHLGEHCFSYCESLETLELPAGLTKIEIRAFRQAEGLTHITIPEGVTVIEQQAFEGCNKLTSVTLPESLTKIGGSAFFGTALTTFHVSAGLETMDNRALPTFSITAYTADENNPNYAADEAGCLYTKDMQTLLYYPVANTRTAFTVPADVKTIDGFAFSDAQYLETVQLPDGLKTIGPRAFSSCRKMTSAYIPDSVTQIGGSAFSFTPLESIHLPASLTYIPGGMFYSCPFTSFEVPEGVTTVEDYAFEWCENLKTVTLPSSLEKIGRDAFYGTVVDEIYFGGSEAQWYAIDIDNMSNGNRRIHEAQKHFTNNFLPEGHDWDDGTVQQTLTCEQPGIRLYTCADCGETYTETVPAIGHRYDSGTRTKAPSCEEKGENIFTCVICGNTYTEEIPAFGHRWEYNIDPSYDESVPGKVGAVCLTNCLHKRFFEIPGYGWVLAFGECGTEGSDVHYVLYQNGTIYVFGNGEIKDQAFFNIGDTYHQTFTKLIIDEGVTAIGKNAFVGNPLGNITLPDSLKTIGDGAFSNIVISNIHFGSGLETIGGGAFDTCFTGSASQKNLVLPDSVKTVKDYAFAYCDGLEEITFGPNVEAVGDQALYCGEHLQKATFLNGNTEIDTGAVSWTPAEFTVYSHAGGKVEAFANAAGYNFVAIDCAGHDWGDWTVVQNSTDTEPGLAQRVCQIDPSHTQSFAIPAYGPATEVGDCGQNGDLVYYIVYEDGTLLITGTGAIRSEMFNFGSVAVSENVRNTNRLIMEDGVTAIGSNAFAFLHFNSISFGSTLVSIGSNAFYDNDGFETVVLPDSVKTVGDGAFALSSDLKAIAFGPNLETVGDWALLQCDNLETVVFWNKDTRIVELEHSAYFGTGLHTVNSGVIYSYGGGAVEAYANENGFPFVAIDRINWITLPFTTDGLSDGDWYLDLDAFVDAVGRGKTEREKDEVRDLIRQHVTFKYNPGGRYFVYRFEYTALPVEDGEPITGYTDLPIGLALEDENAFPYDYNALKDCVRQYRAPDKPDEPEQKQEEESWFQKHIVGPMKSAVSSILSFFRKLFKKNKR